MTVNVVLMEEVAQWEYVDDEEDRALGHTGRERECVGLVINIL